MARSLLQGFVADENGDIQAGASVAITLTLTAATATLYDARTGGSTQTNPVTTDANGQWSAYVEAGLYTAVATAGAYSETVSHWAVSESMERAVGVAASTDIPDRAAADARYLLESNDLSDLDSASTARTNLGLGSIATQAEGTGGGDFRDNTANDARFLRVANNLSDITTASTARANLGVGSSDNVSFGTISGSHATLTGNLTKSVNAGITASTTQTQGQEALTADINEISTCANTNDTVTLPTAAAGLSCVVINNGAQTLQIFPASGDDLGSGADTATTLAAAGVVRYVAYDATNWVAV